MQELDAVNNILASRGLGMTDALDTSYPEVNEALHALRTTARSVLAQGWWFNTERVTLAPTVDGRIYVKANTIAVRNLDTDFVVYLQNESLRHADGYLFTKSVTIDRVFDMLLDEMPVQASDYIAAKALTNAQGMYDGDSTKTGMLRQREAECWAQLNAEHVRNTRYNQYDSANGRHLRSLRWGLR